VVEALMDRIDIEIPIPINYQANLNQVNLKQANIEPFGKMQLETLWEASQSPKISTENEAYLRSIHYYFGACIKQRNGCNPMFELPCESCAYKNEICSKITTLPGFRPAESLLKLARALAWVEGCEQVTQAHIEQLLAFVYGHRLKLSDSIFLAWPHAQAYLSHFFSQILPIKKDLWIEAIQGLVKIKVILQDRQTSQLAFDGNAIDAQVEQLIEAVKSLLSRSDDLVIAWLLGQCLNLANKIHQLKGNRVDSNCMDSNCITAVAKHTLSKASIIEEATNAS